MSNPVFTEQAKINYPSDSNSEERVSKDGYAFLITHDPQPASRADMASEGLPRLHAPILRNRSPGRC